MPPKVARNVRVGGKAKRGNKEAEIEPSPQAIALQQQLDGMSKFCAMMNAATPEFLEKLHNHKSESMKGSTHYKLDEQTILQVVKEIKQAQQPPIDK